MVDPGAIVSMQIDWGSVADWVSGIGSIAASGIALYLSGSERRARKEAERPSITCDITSQPEAEWMLLKLIVENSSTKAWRSSVIEVIRPMGAVVIEQDKAMVTDNGGSARLDETIRDANAKRKAHITINVASAGTPGPPWQGLGARGDRVYRSVFVKRPVGATGGLKLLLHFASLEPVPDRFTVKIIRDLPT